MSSFGVKEEDPEYAEDSGSDEDSVIPAKVGGVKKAKKESDDEDEVEENSIVNSDYESDDDESDDESEPDVSSSTETGLKQDPVVPKYMLDLEDEDDEEEDDDNYLQKFDESLKTNIIAEYHPELIAHNNDEVDVLSRIVRNENGQIIDPLHRTLPFITKYEKARVLGERAKQLNSGAKPFVEVEPSVIDGYLIALKEFEEKKIPFIIKRPLPNGGCEYWRLKDLETL
jgi:DNA-directed RNA polymerase subunit K/omega